MAFSWTGRPNSLFHSTMGWEMSDVEVWSGSLDGGGYMGQRAAPVLRDDETAWGQSRPELRSAHLLPLGIYPSLAHARAGPAL